MASKEIGLDHFRSEKIILKEKKSLLLYPQSHFDLEGTARSRVPQREPLVQRHLLCLQQASQGQC